MNKTIKKYWKDWLILLLIVTNLTALVNKMIRDNSAASAEETILIDKTASPISGKCMKENLQFNDRQTAEFRHINERFHQKVRIILSELNQQKSKIFAELQQPESDTLHLQALSRETGELHRQLKDETNRFYLAIKALCNPEQQQKLQHCFTPLFENRCCPRDKSCKTKNCRNLQPEKIHKP